MSRLGRMPVTSPAGVEVSIAEPNVVTVKGPKGTLTQTMRPEMIIKVEGNVIHVGRPSEDKLHKSLHGLTRSLIHDMVVGVTDGFKKELEINGVGYKASKEGNKLVMNLGYSHLVTMEEIEGITIDVPAPNKVVINGIDKQKVGQFAANVRGKRPPEPYKGKGIKYATETIRHKEGMSGHLPARPRLPGRQAGKGACAAAHLAGALRHCRHLYRARARARRELPARAVVRGGERGV